MSAAIRCVLVVGLGLGLAPVAGAEEPDVRPTWAGARVDYYVNPVNSDLSPSAVVAAVQAGALVWSSQSQASFNFFYAGETDGTSTTYNLKNEIIFRDTTDGDSIATAYTWSYGDTIVDSDIIFWDGAYRYYAGSTGCLGGFFVEDIAAHEFGHAAGIAHSEVPGATMFATVEYCSTSARTLSRDDLNEIERLYPPNGTTRPPSPPVNLIATPSPGRTASSVDLFWADVSLDEDVFVIERSTDGLVFAAVGQTRADVTSFVDLPLVPETGYWYRVGSANAGGQRGSSNVAYVQTTVGPPPPEPSTMPTPANGSGGVGSDAVLRWHPGAGARSFDVYLGTANPPPVYARGVTSPALFVQGLSSGTTYYWSVFANNEGGTSTATPWQFTTGELASGPPSGVTAGIEKGADYQQDDDQGYEEDKSPEP